MVLFEPVVFDVKVIAGEAIAKFTELNAELKVMEEQSIKTGAAMSTFNSKALLLRAGLIAGAFAAFEFGKTAVEAAARTQEAMARLDTALKNTGNATKTASEEVKGFAENARNLGFSVPETATALGTLITATGNVKDSQHLAGVAMDLARYKHIDLGTAATILARGTQGTAKAFKEMGITLDTSLPKQQAINKAFNELEARLKGQNDAYLKTFPGQLKVIGAQFESVASTVGKALIPVLETLGKIMKGMIKFFQDNDEALKALGIVVGLAVVLWKGYEVTIIAVNAVQKIQIALALASAEGIGAMKAAQLLLNDAMKKNAMFLIVTALIAVGAMFIAAWNHSETFRKGVKFVADAVVTFLANMIRAFGGLIEVILNVVTGPLQLFLKALTYLPGVGDAAKEGLHLVRTAIELVGNTADTVANKVEGLKKVIDKLGPSKGSTKETKTPDTGLFDLTNYSGATKSDAAKKLQDAKDAISKIYSDMNKVISDARDSRSALQDDKNKRDAEAQYTYDQAKLQAERSFNDDLYKLNRDHKERIFKINRTYNEAMAAADKNFADTKEKITRENTDALFKIQQAYEQKTNDLVQQANDKRQSIVQKSIDMLTGAFSSATGADIGGMFAALLPKDNKDITNALFNQVKDGVSVAVSWWGKTRDVGIGGLLTDLKSKLAAASKLADDAAKLAALGYSQVFIQQVVAQGSDVGDQMAQAIFSATPESQAQLKDLYDQLQVVSENGVTELATKMSTSATLATSALAKEYAQVQTELDKALATASADMEAAKAEQLRKFAQDMIDANKTLNDARAAAKQTLDDALADEKVAYDSALEDMNTALKNAMKDADTILRKALKDSLTQFNTDIDKLQKDTLDKLAALQVELSKAAATLKELAGVNAAIEAMANSPAAGYVAGTDGTLLSSGAVAGMTDSSGNKYMKPAPGAPQITVYATTNGTDTNSLTNGIAAGIKLGSPLAGTSARGN